MKKVLLLTEGTSTFARDLLKGVAEYSQLHGPWAFYRESLAPFYRYNSDPKSLDYLRRWNADGIIIRSKNSQIIEKALSLKIPTIACDDNQNPQIPNVISDYEMVGRMAAEHLLERGFRHYGYCGFDHMTWSRERGVFFCKAIAEAGHRVHAYAYPKSRKRRLWENEMPLLTQWIRALPKPVAIMACNDDRAHHVLICCNLAGLHIPQQVAVIGVDNDLLLCDLANPPLTSIALNTRKAGFEAAGILDRMIDGETLAGERIYVRPTHVVTRRSTDTLAISDKYVTGAIEYIRKNAREPIQISTVADSVSISARVLYDKFMHHLGRSVHEEIRRVRVEDIAKMLLGTDLPVKQIAQLFRFSSSEHIARYFKAATGMTPLMYRKRYGVSLTESLPSDEEESGTDRF